MITLIPHPVVRGGLLACLVWLWPGDATGQTERGSLTEAFPGLTAKERSRIAKQEEADAKADTAFQRLMAEGEAEARAGRIEEALSTYRKARSVRPYNVYPKVRIQDLEALLAQRGAEPAPAATPVPAAVPLAPEPAPVPPVRSAPAPAPQRPATTTATTAEPPVRSAPVRQPVHTSAKPAATSPPPARTENLPDGIQEREYREGNAFVTERTVTTNGRSIVYKRVVHAWATYHFEDGKPIDERVWRERFGGR